jgi:hypothetical protein
MRIFALAAVVTFILFLSYETARADDSRVQELSHYDGVYELILSTKACPLEEHHGFEWYSYVLDKSGMVAEGCWRVVDQYVDIWVPQRKSHFQMYKKDFRPRLGI